VLLLDSDKRSAPEDRRFLNHLAILKPQMVTAIAETMIKNVWTVGLSTQL
jgi:hypothetical protein